MSCYKCELLVELYEQAPETARNYFVMTELFMELHGFDYCDDRESRDRWAEFNRIRAGVRTNEELYQVYKEEAS